MVTENGQPKQNWFCIFLNMGPLVAIKDFLGKKKKQKPTSESTVGTPHVKVYIFQRNGYPTPLKILHLLLPVAFVALGT